jgi:Ribbon-helix-helix protein, copG family
MKKIKSISLGPEDLERLTALKTQLGWSESQVIRVLLEQARLEGGFSLRMQKVYGVNPPPVEEASVSA